LSGCFFALAVAALALAASRLAAARLRLLKSEGGAQTCVSGLPMTFLHVSHLPKSSFSFGVARPGGPAAADDAVVPDALAGLAAPAAGDAEPRSVPHQSLSPSDPMGLPSRPA
jgi:hypothetical protein